MLSDALKQKCNVFMLLSGIMRDENSLTILMELVRHKHAGTYPVSHENLSNLEIFRHEHYNWQSTKQKLVDDLKIVEMLVEEGKPFGPESISYQLNPAMDPFCAELIEMLFSEEEGVKQSIDKKGIKSAKRRSNNRS